MAGFNEILTGRFNRYLQKLTQIKGSPPVPSLATEMMPTIPTEPPELPVENRYLAGIDQFWLAITTGVVAAQNSAVRLRNPVGSNTLVTIEWLGLSETVNDLTAPYLIMHILSNSAVIDLPSSQNASTPIDGRTVRKSTLIMSQNTNVGTPSGTFALQIPIAANGFFSLQLFEDMEIVMAPGTVIQFTTTVLNTQLQVSAKWRERFLEDSERA